MPSAMISSDSTVPRVPAWKRLGLKLKNASDVPQPLQENKETPTATDGSSKRKSEAELNGDTSVKKPRASRRPEDSVPLTTPSQSPAQTKLKRQKSVSFTPETKTEDGDSIKQLYVTWAEQQDAFEAFLNLPNTNRVSDIPEPPHVATDVDPNLDESESRRKPVQSAEGNGEKKTPKKLKSKSKSKPSKEDPPKNTPLDLTYLQEFHDSKDTWKFNKVHQSRLLKNCFDIELIPASHINLFYEYIAGLQGGARRQLRNSAIAIKVKDQEEGEKGFPETMENRLKRQRDYEDAVAEYVATLTAEETSSKMGYEEGKSLGLSDLVMQKRMAKRMRAETILRRLAQETNGGDLSSSGSLQDTRQDDDSQKRVKLNDGSTQKLARKRKQRTAAVDTSSEESSSEESSSEESSESEESSSDEESDHHHSERGEESTSSESSSDGSEIEDDSDSDDSSDSD